MKVNLGTIEIDDLVRRAVRYRVGKPGLATREEVRSLFRSLAGADIEVIVSDYERDIVRRASKRRDAWND